MKRGNEEENDEEVEFLNEPEVIFTGHVNYNMCLNLPTPSLGPSLPPFRADLICTSASPCAQDKANNVMHPLPMLYICKDRWSTISV